MPNPPQLPPYIYGLHDVGGLDMMLAAERPGWVLDTVDLRTQAGADYASLADAGFGIIVRLNHGYGTTGTIPPSNQYDAFAALCADYVKNSSGAHIWVIGNEMNTSAERPQLANGSREVITPAKYSKCFLKCRVAIKSLPGHADDWVVPGAVGPYNNETTYPGNASGDWVQYMIDLLNLLGAQVDGLALHCYTHEFRTDQVSDERLMNAPFNHRHYNLRTYRDFLNALPSTFRHLPVLITETNPVPGWRDSNIAWVQSAYQEINTWNLDLTRQAIQALVLFRWHSLDEHPEWGMQDKPALAADFQEALRLNCRVRRPGNIQKAAPAPRPEYRAQWMQTLSIPAGSMPPSSTVNGRVIVKNIGEKTWAAKGANPVRLGYHWYNPKGLETPVAAYAGNWSLSNDVAPGGTVMFDNVELRAPQWLGTFSLKWDLVLEGATWFSARQSPTHDEQVTVVGLVEPRPIATQARPATLTQPAPVQEQAPRFQAILAGATSAASRAFTGVAAVPAADLDGWAAVFFGQDTPYSMAAGQSATVNLRMRNTGSQTWMRDGDNPVHVGYKWFNAAGQQQMDVDDRRTALPTNVVPDQETALGATLVAPKTPGNYLVHWDLVAEGITWFADTGSSALVVPVRITALPRDVSGWRVESNLNPQAVSCSLDGDPRTYWDARAQQAAGQWFRLNLAQPRVIDGLQFLSPGKGFPAGYSLRVSADGRAWLEIAHVPAENAHDVMTVFAPLSMQYAQIDLVSASKAPTPWMISEILVHIAAAWTASASHNSEAAAYAIDNRSNTAWSSLAPQAPGMWFQIDLGRVETVSGLTLLPPANENPYSFRIATWNARSSRWQVVYDKSNNHTRVDVVFNATQTQFINIQLLHASDRPWAIREARVVREMDTWLGPGT